MKIIDPSLEKIVVNFITKSLEINCPLCLSNFGDKYTMLVEGDDSSYLFCPHCNFTIQIAIASNSYVFRKKSFKEWTQLLEVERD